MQTYVGNELKEVRLVNIIQMLSFLEYCWSAAILENNYYENQRFLVSKQKKFI